MRLKGFLLTLGVMLLGTSVGAQTVTVFPPYFPSPFSMNSTGGVTLTQGQLLLPDGTNAAPPLAAANDSDTGIRIGAAANAVDLISGGTNTPARYQNTQFTVYSNSGQFRLGASADVVLNWDAANTLALRNGVNAQAFNIYNTYTDASNYERAELMWTSNQLRLSTSNAGTGAVRDMYLNPSGGIIYTKNLHPSATNTYNLGSATASYSVASVATVLYGSRSKALTEASATNFVTIAIPQTAGANYGGGEVRYSVYATDGTDSQVLNGSAVFSAVNKAGTETCTLTDDQIGTEAASAGTLACTITCVVGLVDVVALAADCTSSLAQTALNIEYRLDMPKPNTATPQ